MERILSFLLLFAALLSLTACAGEAPASASSVPTTLPPVTETVPETVAPEGTVHIPAPPQRVLELTEEEKSMLLKIAMAERGHCGCPECIALVMCTVLNRVKAEKFGNSIYSVLHAQNQYTPVVDGSYYRAKPNENCYDALDMVLYGWDESRGATYYEWCKGESWHSQNLDLIFQHCDIRFYH